MSLERTYDGNYLERVSRMFASSKELGYQWLSPGAGETILDVGCGIGLDAIEFSNTGVNVVAIDADESFIKEAKQRHATNQRINFLVGNIFSLPLVDHSIDKVWVDRVFQHLPDHDLALKELNRVLKPGGKLFLMDTYYNKLLLNFRDSTSGKHLIDYMIRERFPYSLALSELPVNMEISGFSILRQGIEYHRFLGTDQVHELFRFHKLMSEMRRKDLISKETFENWVSDKDVELQLPLGWIYAEKRC
ncbi:class I SAM-dependent methyltransferase [Roseivirga sp.]|uniref:class I SAM-dependent methyltransferase n=1 Tax=Roseivirga sp. TaxID=1964215 RepID=UPI003B51E971